jgi:hypothetical protein
MLLKLMTAALLLSIVLLSCTSPTASVQSKPLSTFTEKDFIQNKFFFLDTVYLSYYVKRRTSVPAVNVQRFQAWLSNAKVNTDAQIPDSLANNTFKAFGPNHQMFKLLKMNQDYYVSASMGFIRFDSLRVTNNDLIGIHLETLDSTLISGKGVFVDISDTAQTVAGTLWILNPSGQDSAYPTFKLMWRNVYPLPAGFDPTTFNVRIVSTRDTTRDKTPAGIFFSRVLGLADNQGRALTVNMNIYDIDHSLIIIPPFDSSASGNEPFSNPALGNSFTNSWIYKMVGSDFSNIVPMYRIYCTARL